MSKPILNESKSVFLPRGTATYTPKWSIVVLTLACLGVLKFSGPGGKATSARQTVTTESPSPTAENKAQPIRPVFAPTAVLVGFDDHDCSRFMVGTRGKNEVTMGGDRKQSSNKHPRLFECGVGTE